MRQVNAAGSVLAGFFVFLGLTLLGYQLASAIIKFKSFERYVTVKGLAEREVPANIGIWPLQYSVVGNDLTEVYAALENDAQRIREFLLEHGFDASEITLAPPAVVDKLAQQYGNEQLEFRYTANQTLTVYTHKVQALREAKNQMAELGKTGILFLGEDYGNTTEFLFTGLNDIKPAMIEEATHQAREVALKFARDSASRLGKIRKARQGQFSIEPRDRNNPHIKKVRVVSTLEYYLSD